MVAVCLGKASVFSPRNSPETIFASACLQGSRWWLAESGAVETIVFILGKREGLFTKNLLVDAQEEED